MATSVSCLTKNTSLVRDLKDLVEYIGYTRIAQNKSADIGSIYNDIRKAGIEIDLQTVGYLYNEALPKTFKQIMSYKEVNEFVLKDYADAIQRAALLEDKEGEQQIGKNSAEIHVVNGILNMFTDANVADERTKSDMLKIQNALWKGIQRKLNLPENSKPKDKVEWKNILNEALGYEKLGLTDLNGKLNSISDLYNAMKDQLADAKSELRKQALPSDVARFEEMIKQLESSTYSLLFSKGEAKTLLNEMIKVAGFGKTLKNGNTIINWNKLAGDIGSVQDIRENVQRVLEDNGYNADVIEGVKNSLENEFNDLQVESIQKQLTNTKQIASEGAKDIISQAVDKFLGGKTMAEWVKDGNIETVEQLEEEVFNELKDKNYQPTVRSAIIERLKDFFNSNYAKVESKEAQNAIESLGINAPSPIRKSEKKEKHEKSGKTVIQWIKDNGIQNKQELFEALDKQLDARVISPAIIDNIKKEFARILDLENKAQTELTNRQKATEREVVSKTDLKRLAELNNLGIFDGTHNGLLHNLIGVSDLQQQDISDLKEISQAASDLYRHIDKNYGNDVYGSSALQSLQRSIDSIIARNINNKSRALKVVSGINNFFQVYLTGLLMAPLTLVENAYSGIKEVIAPLFIGRRGLSQEDLYVYLNVLLDVSKRGQSFGEEVGSFAPRELYVNTLKFKWKDATRKEKAETLLYILMLPGRVGLLGLDSANKVLITNKTFHNAVYQSLTVKGKNRYKNFVPMSHDDATKFMNEALHGQSFEDAKKQAKEILEKTNSALSDKYKITVNNSTIIRLANDLVKANLNTNGRLPNDIIESALKSSYHVAGLGLGHEPNNPISKGIKDIRDSASKEEQRLINEKDWNGLVWRRLLNTFINNMFIRFTGGATNWVFLRLQGAGLGIVTGILGNWNNDIDFKNKESVQRTIKEIHSSRNKIGRGLTGISVTAVAYFLKYLLAGNDDDEEKQARLAELKAKKKLTDKQKEEIATLTKSASVYRRIKSNYEGNRLFKKVAPDIMLFNYYLDTDKTTFDAFADYASNQLGIGSQYSAVAKFNDARELNSRGDYNAAQGELASILGDRIGVPVWRSYKEWYKLDKWIGGGEVATDYKQPTEFWEGIWGGGLIEELGVYNRDSKITNLPGIGMKTYEKFQAKGIERMSDLNKHPNWWLMQYKNDKGNPEYILDASARKKAREAAEKYEKQK